MTEIRKWHVEKSQKHRIKGWKIIIDTIRSTTGSQRIESYYRMEGRDICNVVAITPEHNIVLVRQYRHGLGEITLEVPGGIADRKEDIKLAAIRELEEETGYSGDQIHLIGNYQINPGLLDSYICSYLLLLRAPVSVFLVLLHLSNRQYTNEEQENVYSHLQQY